MKHIIVHIFQYPQQQTDFKTICFSVLKFYSREVRNARHNVEKYQRECQRNVEYSSKTGPMKLRIIPGRSENSMWAGGLLPLFPLCP